MSGPFKMKGNPMQRNFGISPVRKSTSFINKLKAAKDTISEINDSSTIGQMYRSYKRKKSNLTKDEMRDNKTK